jgi:HSP20 family protein
MQRSFVIQWSQLQRKAAGMDELARPLSGAPPWSPNTDIFEGPDGLIVRVELAGVSADAIELLVDDNALVLRGVRRDPHRAETASGFRFRQMEMDFGPFERVLQLPFAVDGAAASASMQNGILSIRLPRAAAPQMTHVRIRPGGAL